MNESNLRFARVHYTLPGQSKFFRHFVIANSLSEAHEKTKTFLAACCIPGNIIESMTAGPLDETEIDKRMANGRSLAEVLTGEDKAVYLDELLRREMERENKKPRARHQTRIFGEVPAVIG